MPVEPGVGGAWRFDILIERADAVVAAIAALGPGVERPTQTETISRLRSARARGIAKAGFLVAPMLSGERRGAEAVSPLTVVAINQPGLAWQLAVYEA